MITAKLNVSKTERGYLVYEVEVNGLRYQSLPTNKTYVAMYLTVHTDWSIKNTTGVDKDMMSATYRFDRMDLVGKGDSKHFDTSSDKKVFAAI